jgi:uncharacterized glyoxalase superfamily protein PhnB
MRFGYTIVYVADVEAAIAFYESAFGLSRRFVSEDGSYGELHSGETTLAFASYAQAESVLPGGFRRHDPAEPPAGVEIGFVTDDVETAWQRALDHGAVAVVSPQVKPWGQTVAYVRDAEGMLVEICTPVG